MDTAHRGLAHTLRWLLSPEEVVLLMLNALAGLASWHRLQLLLSTVGAITNGFAVCDCGQGV